MNSPADQPQKKPENLAEMDYEILCEQEGEEFAKKALLMTEALNQEDLKKEKTIN